MRTIDLVIVDYEESTITRLEELFNGNSELNVNVTGAAYNYNNFIHMLEERYFEMDVILINAYLPDLMGIQLIPFIKHHYPDVKIITMVSHQTKNLIQAAQNYGTDHIIQKPFKVGSLVDMLHNIEIKPKEETKNFLISGQLEGIDGGWVETRAKILKFLKNDEDLKVNNCYIEKDGVWLRIRFAENGKFYLYQTKEGKKEEIVQKAKELKKKIESFRMLTLFLKK